MANSIHGLSQLNQLFTTMAGESGLPGEAPAAGSADFQNMLLDVLSQTNTAGAEARQAIGEYQMETGITKPEVFVAMRKAELALRMTMQIRNKLVEAFDEIQQMRM